MEMLQGTYTLLEIRQALHSLANKNKRPEYSPIIGRELRLAILNEKPHVLKNAVLGILEHKFGLSTATKKSLDMAQREKQLNEDRILGLKIKENYSADKIAQIGFIAEWCITHRGGATMLMRHIGMSFYKFHRCIRFLVDFDDSLLMHCNILIERLINNPSLIEVDTLGVSSDDYLIALLNRYCIALLNQAFVDVTTGKSEVEAKAYLADMQIPFGTVNGYSPVRCLSFNRTLQEIGIIKIDTTGTHFQLTALPIACALHELAFNTMTNINKTAKYRDGITIFSRSTLGRPLLKSLINKAVDLYDLNNNPLNLAEI